MAYRRGQNSLPARRETIKNDYFPNKVFLEHNYLYLKVVYLNYYGNAYIHFLVGHCVNIGNCYVLKFCKSTLGVWCDFHQ